MPQENSLWDSGYPMHAYASAVSHVLHGVSYLPDAACIAGRAAAMRMSAILKIIHISCG